MYKGVVFVGLNQEQLAQGGCRIVGNEVMSVNTNEVLGKITGEEILFLPRVGAEQTLKSPEICPIGKFIWSRLLGGFVCLEVKNNFVVPVPESGTDTSVDEEIVHDLVRYTLDHGESREDEDTLEKCVYGKLNMSVYRDRSSGDMQFEIWDTDRATGTVHLARKIRRGEYVCTTDQSQHDILQNLHKQYIH